MGKRVRRHEIVRFKMYSYILLDNADNTNSLVKAKMLENT